MLFSVFYKSAHLAEADEIRCPYNQLGQIYDFIKEHPEKRYVIDVYRIDSVDVLLKQLEYVIAVVGDNYTVCCGNIGIYNIVKKNNENYNAYINFPVVDWETFNLIKNYGVTDIYIDGPIGFDMETIAKKKDNVKIRVSPTRSPNSAIFKHRSENSFYIRPEDISNPVYDIIDVIDFQIDNQEKEDVLFNIYKRESFSFDIDNLVSGLRPGVSNIRLEAFGDFAERRANCKQRCQSTGNCHYCQTVFLLAEKLFDLTKKDN